MTWMHAGKMQGFNYSPLTHELAEEHGINSAYIQNQNIQITHQALIMLASLNFYDQQQVLKEIHFVVKHPNTACKPNPNPSLFKRLYRTRYPFDKYHYLIQYKINDNNQVVIFDILFDRSLLRANDAQHSHERNAVWHVKRKPGANNIYDEAKDRKQLTVLQTEWELGEPVNQIRTEHAAVNGMLNELNKATWLMGVHAQVAYPQDDIRDYTLFHNPSDKWFLDLIECGFDKRRGKKSHNAQHLAEVLHQRQMQGKATKWLVHSQGAIIFCAALEHFHKHYSSLRLSKQEVAIHGSGSYMPRIQSIAHTLGMKVHKERNNPFDFVPNVAGRNDMSGSSLQRSLQFFGLIVNGEPLASPHTLPYLGIETYKNQLQLLGYDKKAAKVQQYINKSTRA
ncbi:hypothetical protein [Litoribrevibacter albus]|uniref:Uncharacterized protein n=1 Tax=Litoribrevibacter albus TaxID=1473156 RepID=A0AA37S9H1_9GAMM|nr:hypothetical protein [Litoribrevibacter albus]GLQ31545.1 hypothetical protein GCM10007876_20240 [Litoribrevibacter albus]